MSEFTNTVSLIEHLKLLGFSIKRRDFKKFGLFNRIEYIATDGNVFIYFEPSSKYFLAVATDEEICYDDNKGISETLFYHNKSKRSNKLFICNNDYSISEIVGAVNDYKGGII